jgi:CheY-like chemotaxis protein
MHGKHVVVFTKNRLTRRQIARTLCSTGTKTCFSDIDEDFNTLLLNKNPDLAILDCDNKKPDELNPVLDIAQEHRHIPLVLLSTQMSKQSLLSLIDHVDIDSVNALITKHDEKQDSRPALDERELLVTCEKVLCRDIFGIEKYLGSWGVTFHHDTITSRVDKSIAFKTFSSYLEQLDCPPRIAATILTVAEELILNAVVHAPVDATGVPKHEHLPLRSEMLLEPHEHVEFRYGCDGQRLMLSVSDNFGRLDRRVINRCLRPTHSLDSKPSGAGVGLSLALSKIHQLIFNVQKSVKTEAIAGWHLRVHSTSQFLSVGKSLSMFQLPADSQPVEAVNTNMQHYSGPIKGDSNLDAVVKTDIVDLRNATFDDGGTYHWAEMLAKRADQPPLTVMGCPDSMVRRLTLLGDALKQMRISSVVMSYHCNHCEVDIAHEFELLDLPESSQGHCADCGATLEPTTDNDIYRELIQKLKTPHQKEPETPQAKVGGRPKKSTSTVATANQDQPRNRER